MAHAFFLGVDPAVDASANALDANLTLLEKEKQSDAAAATYRLNHIRRHTDGVSADALADHIQGLVADQPYIGRTTLVVNCERSAGDALVASLNASGLDPVAARLIGKSGSGATELEATGPPVGTAEAVRILADLYRDDRLEIDTHAPEAASELARGLQWAAEHLDEADAPATTGSTPDSLHDADGLLRSAALAAWVGTERSFDPSQHLKESPQTQRPGAGDPGA